MKFRVTEAYLNRYRQCRQGERPPMAVGDEVEVIYQSPALNGFYYHVYVNGRFKWKFNEFDMKLLDPMEEI